MVEKPKVTSSAVMVILDNWPGQQFSKRITQMSIWTKFRFIPSSGSEEDFQRFPIFKLFRSHGSHLGCRARSHNFGRWLSKFCPIWPSSSWEEDQQTTVSMMGKAHTSIWLWWAKNILSHCGDNHKKVPGLT